jgi:hypothetical protein
VTSKGADHGKPIKLRVKNLRETADPMPRSEGRKLPVPLRARVMTSVL